MSEHTIAFIGGGNMARSLASGLLKNGWRPEQIIVADPDSAARQTLEQTLGITTTDNNISAVQQADIVVLAVKPQMLANVARELADAVTEKKPLVISIAAGIRTRSLANWLGDTVTIVRAMPNTAALIGSGATGLYASKQVDDESRDIAESILRAAGIVVWVDNEDLMDVVTALSGSGPAYFFLVMEALENAAVKQGLNAKTARLLTLETAFGAAKMALENSEEPARLRQHVTSPGGTTEKAIQSFEDNNIHAMFEQAIDAATKRSRELAELLGKDK